MFPKGFPLSQKAISGSHEGKHTSDFLFGYEPGEIFKRPVISFFRVFRKKTSRQLPFLQVIRNAVAAKTFTVAGVVGTTAHFKIGCLFAVHDHPQKNSCYGVSSKIL